MNTAELWKKRFHLFLKEIRIYGKYVFNDHLKFVLIFAIGIGAYYYGQWLKTLSPSFPSALLIAAVFSIMLANGSVQTFVKQPDIVFLLPLEEKMKPYFSYAFRYSYFVQVTLLMLVGLIVAPLYSSQIKQPSSTYILLLIMLAIVKLWNLLIAWERTYVTDERIRNVDWVVRLCISFVFTYGVVASMSIIFTGTVVLVMAVYLFSLYRKGKQGRNWEQLILQEEKKMMLLYRIANVFTDVPQLKERVKRRRWLDFIANTVTFSQMHTYSYLYIRTFLRSGNYFGMFVRQILLGGVILYFVPFLYVRLFISVLFLYLMSYQLLSLAKQHRLKLWIDLYPIEIELQQKAFQSLLLQLLIVTSIVFTGIFAAAARDWVMTGVLLLGNVFFSVGFTYVYISKRVKSLSS